MKHPWLAIPGIILLSLHSALAAPTLKVGDPAPALKVGKWIKGQPVEKLGDGSVQVVEFWATWCGPCKKSAPHLSELAKKFEGKARIIGVSIWETEKTDHEKRLEAVGKFVTAMGDKMDYIVAADDNDGFMAKNWMEAAGEGGIPTAFIVGKDGKIAWIGYPWSGLDEKLEQTIAGTLDVKAIQAEATQRQAEKDAKSATNTLLQPVSDLQTQNKPQEAIAALNKIVGEHPELAAKTGFLRFRLLLSYDDAAANTQARKLLEDDFKENPGALYTMARDLTERPGLKHQDWDLIVDLAKRAVELDKSTNPSTMSVLATAWHGKGDIDKAVEAAEAAVKLAEANSDLPQGSKDHIQGKLKAYKAKQEKAAKPAAPAN